MDHIRIPKGKCDPGKRAKATHLKEGHMTAGAGISPEKALDEPGIGPSANPSVQ